MTRVRVDLNISLDGYASTVGDGPHDPFGEDWARLTAAYVGTRTFRERVLGKADGSGTTGVDDNYAAQYFEGVGAEVMGAGMFGLTDHRDDPDWRGWWGDTPPFGFTVYVLTHSEREPLEFANGTRFEFLNASPEEALLLARESAGGADVRIGGGPTTVRHYLRAGLVDSLHVAVVPVVLGRGINLWDDLRGLESGYRVTAESADSGVTHFTFEREDGS
ncbi:dihydrofolate reductase family protein [Demequina globuliformis]|uniref:dihydrofolate reductase family protein n=1 Tax=Demequina globuliformis TaxID=676202 RepID=UPI00078285B5|nr:dihydrofolate reductase family protein [Demequina globuliformis]